MVEYGAQAAVAEFEDEDLFLYISNNDKLLPSNTLNLGSGECVLIDYKIDLDEAYVTEDARGTYSPVTLTSTPTTLKLWTAIENPDTADVRPLERAVGSFQQRAEFLKNRLFLFTSYTIQDSLQFANSYEIGYFKKQDAKIDTSLYKEKNVPYFELFLRVDTIDNTAGTRTTERTQYDRNAFAITDFVKNFSSYAVDDTLYVRIKYAKSFNSDTTRINWGESQTIKLGLR
ncbi:MAG: hypothetical protein LIP01_03275 [Tannerellaceae bacterium]|nr:hypothetical protein [Tannerellaceae bacterium]